MKFTIEDKRLEQLRCDAQSILNAANGYRPFDRDKLGALPKPDGSLMVVAWEAAHGHDVRTKCYAEYGCQLLEVEGAENTIVLLDALSEKNARIANLRNEQVIGIGFMEERDALRSRLAAVEALRGPLTMLFGEMTEVIPRDDLRAALSDGGAK